MKAYPQKHLGIEFRSRSEARWAEFFNDQQIPFVYEPDGFLLSDGDSYLPDFWLPDAKVFFEVKPYKSTDREDRVAEKLAAGSGRVVVIAFGGPSIEVQLVAINPIGRHHRAEIIPDNDETGAWLVGCAHGQSWKVAMRSGLSSPYFVGNQHHALKTAGAFQFQHKKPVERMVYSRDLLNSRLVRAEPKEREVFATRYDERPIKRVL